MHGSSTQDSDIAPTNVNKIL